MLTQQEIERRKQAFVDENIRSTRTAMAISLIDELVAERDKSIIAYSNLVVKDSACPKCKSTALVEYEFNQLHCEGCGWWGWRHVEDYD